VIFLGVSTLPYTTGENLLYLLGGGIMMALALGLILLLFFRKRKGRKEQED
jgi:hypothetical protein